VWWSSGAVNLGYHKEVVKLYTDKEPCVEVTVWRKPTLTMEVWLRIKKGE